MNTLVPAILIGLLAGAHTSSWGMYKDAPHEGFTFPKYSRSIIVATVAAVILALIVELNLILPSHLSVFFGLVYAAERLTLELWKSFLREEDQSKYFIPMQFGVMGKPIQSRAVRWSVFAAILVLLAVLLYLANWLMKTYPDANPWLVLITVGSIGGWLTAFGGAWKDAPVEGFETFKFFRSPMVALTWAIIMSFFTTNWIYIAVAGAGYSVATIETYKTFFFPNKPRGKFAGKPILFPKILEQRRIVAVLYACIWVVIIALLVLGFTGLREGLLP
ncbi:MAG TPA: hypothetical protein VF647_01230 [Longimicrobium sp.]|jgi:hypothetical protein